MSSVILEQGLQGDSSHWLGRKQKDICCCHKTVGHHQEKGDLEFLCKNLDDLEDKLVVKMQIKSCSKRVTMWNFFSVWILILKDRFILLCKYTPYCILKGWSPRRLDWGSSGAQVGPFLSGYCSGFPSGWERSVPESHPVCKWDVSTEYKLWWTRGSWGCTCPVVRAQWDSHDQRKSGVAEEQCWCDVSSKKC